jgi:TonB family protein
MSPRLFVVLMSGALSIGMSILPLAAAPKSGGDKRDARTPAQWLQVEPVVGGDVARVYREQLLSWYRTSGAMKEGELAALPDADYFAFRPDLTSFAIEQGEFAGQWTFMPPREGRWPDTAVQVIDRSDAGNYRVLARIYCDPAATTCRTLREDTLRMPPPEPPIDVASAGYAAWEQLVMQEACSPAPIAKAVPKYPASLAMAGEGGRVVLRLLLNPCGEVRAVRLGESSGQAKLDQATIDTAWQWRLYSERKKEGAKVEVPVDFIPPTYESSPGGRAERASR